MIFGLLSPRANARAIADCVGTLVGNRAIVIEMVRREISDRYVGQVFGLAWVIVYPLFMVGLWVFVFTVVMKAKIGGAADLPLDYTAYLLAGLVPWLSFQDSMVRSCTVVVSNGAMIRQGLFRPEILPAKVIISALITQMIMLSIFCIYVADCFSGHRDDRCRVRSVGAHGVLARHQGLCRSFCASGPVHDAAFLPYGLGSESRTAGYLSQSIRSFGLVLSGSPVLRTNRTSVVLGCSRSWEPLRAFARIPYFPKASADDG